VAQLDRLEEALGVRFDNISLLQQALIHSSYVNENPNSPLPSNERLEFLGDALLNFLIAQGLYSLSPPLAEGKMSKLRASLVCEETLSSLSLSLGLGEYLQLGRGEEATGGRQRPSNLARALEAVLGAILLDQGMEKAKEVVWRLLSNQWGKVLRGETFPDYKSQLQEYLQKRGLPPPIYRVVEERGEAHAKSFVVEVWVREKALGKGWGRSKKKAEMEAARSALISLAKGQVI